MGVPAARLGPRSCAWPYLGTGEGAAGPGGVRAAVPLAGVTSTFPGRTYSPCQVLQERHPSPWPGGHLARTGSPRFPLGTSGRGRLGSQDPSPALLVCPPAVH